MLGDSRIPTSLSLARFEAMIDSIHHHKVHSGEIQCSIIIVAYQSGSMLLNCLDSLTRQDFPGEAFEIILVDNGGNEASYSQIAKIPATHIIMRENTGCSDGKNIGALHASGDIVCFIDDDGVADPNFVQGHLQAHQQYPQAVGVRGKVLPKDTRNIYNGLAWHYDLRDEVIPCYIDTETNASFKRAAFIEIGGFLSPVIRGDSEGINLSYRIMQCFKDPMSLIYTPNAIVQHDFANSLRKLFKKCLSQARAGQAISRDYPEIEQYIRSYHLPLGVMHVKRTPTNRVKLALLRRMYHLVRWAATKYYSQATADFA